MIDIEKIADSISPKKTIVRDAPLLEDIYIARDIKDLKERKRTIDNLVKKDKENRDFTERSIKRAEKKGRYPVVKQLDELYGLDKKSKLLQLQSHDEIKYIQDLIDIEYIMGEYEKLTGENTKQHFLYWAKIGMRKQEMRYRRGYYFTDAEFAKIVQIAADEIDELPAILLRGEQSPALNAAKKQSPAGNFTLIKNLSAKDCFDKLKTNDFIDNETVLTDFNKIFSTKAITKKIKWVGSIKELARFIHYLHNGETKACNEPANNIFSVASNCFEIDGETINADKLRNNNRDPKQSRLDILLSAIRDLTI